MRFVRSSKTDITWLFYEGSKAELQRCSNWIARNRTMWVIEGKITWDEDNVEVRLRQMQARARSLPDPTPYTQGFAFKSPSDALRFKLSMVQ